MTSESTSQNSGEGTTKTTDMFSAPKQDFLASIVVFLVALPLCMGIAIASGVPVAAGLITGIVGGLVVGFLAGAPLQVSGPAAGLTVIVYDLVQRHGLEVLGTAVFIGGTLQLLAGVFRYGGLFRAVSPAVIYGMLAGIGVLIFSSQFHVMVDDKPKGSGIKNLISIPDAIRKGLPIPELRTPEERRVRRDLLQDFGALHEQQVQIRELAAERIPVPVEGEEEDEDQEKESSEPDLLKEMDLQPLAVKQQELLENLKESISQLHEKGISETVRDPSALKLATSTSLVRCQDALEDLQEKDTDNIRSSQEKIQHSLEDVLNQLKNHDWAAKVGLVTILILMFWNAAAPSKLKLIPAPLVAVALATVLAVILKLPVLYVEVPDNLWSEIHFPSLSVLQSVHFGVIFQAGVVLAIVASAETLLCATAVDQMQTDSRTNYDKELAAQGVGNMVCGFVGALPMTGVIVRSSANVEAGGKTRLSTILHGVWLLVFVSFLAFVLRMIPTAALAAMLVYTGYKLVNVKMIKELRNYGRGEVSIYAATLIAIVCTDLLTGVLTGVALSAAKLLHKFSHLKVYLDVQEDGKKSTLKLMGAATFIRLPRLANVLEEVPDGSDLHIDFDQLMYIDHACLNLLSTWAKQHESTGGTLTIDWESLHANFHSKPHRQTESDQGSAA